MVSRGRMGGIHEHPYCFFTTVLWLRAAGCTPSLPFYLCTRPFEQACFVPSCNVLARNLMPLHSWVVRQGQVSCDARHPSVVDLFSSISRNFLGRSITLYLSLRLSDSNTDIDSLIDNCLSFYVVCVIESECVCALPDPFLEF